MTEQEYNNLVKSQYDALVEKHTTEHTRKAVKYTSISATARELHRIDFDGYHWDLISISAQSNGYIVTAHFGHKSWAMCQCSGFKFHKRCKHLLRMLKSNKKWLLDERTNSQKQG